MNTATAVCIYKLKLWKVVDLAREHGLSTDVFRGRLKFCKERAKHEGDLIPVVTDHELRRVGMPGSGCGRNRNTLSAEWLSKPLVK